MRIKSWHKLNKDLEKPGYLLFWSKDDETGVISRCNACFYGGQLPCYFPDTKTEEVDTFDGRKF